MKETAAKDTHNFRQYLASCLASGRPVFFDGGMGTMLQASGVSGYGVPEELNFTHPDVIKSIHRAYLDAGANIITTNTFGCTPIKMQGVKYSAEETAKQAVALAKAAIRDLSGLLNAGFSVEKHFAAFDIGPTGHLLEPMGDLSFDAAYDNFARVVKAAEEAGADLVIIETMSDLYEAKAAILAVKENTSLPVIATATFQPNLRTLTGADVETAVTYLEALSPDAIGWNCGGSLEDAAKLTADFVRFSRLPVLAQPNAGLPVIEDGKTIFKVHPEDFAHAQAVHFRTGAALLGGCCGTTPAHVAAMVKEIAPGASLRTRNTPTLHRPTHEPSTRVSSGRQTVEIGGGAGPVIIGERINPTGKKKCKEALLAGNMQFILDEAASQIGRGAHILDVNVGLPGIDEGDTMALAVSLLQKTFPVPLQIDSSESAVIERALRYYNGKALVNSVNGKQETMDAIFPLIKKYGGAVVALTLDETGIPPTAAGRIAIAGRIINEAAKYGISPADILIDTLTLTVSSQQDEALETLKAIALIKEKYGAKGVKTVLGVSNISFGLPRREIVNSRFFGMALYAGLDACIINPLSADMLQTYHAYRALAGFDKNCGDYIGHYADTSSDRKGEKGDTPISSPSSPLRFPASAPVDLKQIIIKGYKDRAGEATKDLLKTLQPLEVINSYIVPALDVVGAEFESGRFFLPQLLLSADTVSSAFEEIKAAFAASGETRESAGTIALATVYGDIHDIGKNIVKALLENYGYTVLDLGKNVSAETIIQTVITHHVKLVGLSALMTTTVANMEKTIAALKAALEKHGESCVIMAGGAVLTEEYAKKIGADYYAKDALAAIAIAKEVFA